MLTQLQQRLYFIGQAWTKNTTNLLDLFVQERMLMLVPSGVQAWIRRGGDLTSEEMAHLGDEYIMSTIEDTLTQTHRWTSKGEKGREGNNSYSKGKSYRSGTDEKKKGEKTEDRTRREPDPNWDPQKGAKCRKCAEWGHIAKNCPQKECMVIQAIGEEQDWATVEGSINGKPASRILLDSGCTRSMVHPRFLDKNYRQTGLTGVANVDQEKSSYPTTRVELRLEAGTMQPTLGVNQKMRWDAILGKDIRLTKMALRNRMDETSDETSPSAKEEQADRRPEVQKKRRAKRRKRASPQSSESSQESEKSGTRRSPRPRR